jgi:voltage-gated potassium channel
MAASLVTLRKRLNRLFDDSLPQGPAAHLWNAALALLIVVNVGSVILESVEALRDEYDAVFWWIEQVATVVFAVEYVLRVWTSVDLADGQYRDPLRGRLRYMRSFFALVDLVSVLPALLGFLGAADLRSLRLLRLLRMLKLTRHSTVFALLWAVFREEARSIAAILFIIALTLTMSGSLMYMIENEAQPKVFSSIPAAMWWAIETLTTVGYGDIVPVTIAGRILGGFVSIVGIGTLALFSGLITVSFMDQLRLRRERYRRVLEARLATGPLSQAEIRTVEHLAIGMGMGEDVAKEEVEEAIEEQAHPGRRHCPHCGYDLSRHEAADQHSA